MLGELAPGGVFGGFAAAPPHFTAVLRPMSTTGPVEVLLLQVLLAAELAYLLVDVVVPAVLQLLYPLSHLVPLVLQHLHDLVGLLVLLLKLRGLLQGQLKLIISELLLILHLLYGLLLVLIVLFHDSRHILQLDPQLVPLHGRRAMLVVE